MERARPWLLTLRSLPKLCSGVLSAEHLPLQNWTELLSAGEAEVLRCSPAGGCHNPSQAPALCCSENTQLMNPGLEECWDVLQLSVSLQGSGQDWSGWELLWVCTACPTPGQFQRVWFLTLLMS